jgi:hypothetical protein
MDLLPEMVVEPGEDQSPVCVRSAYTCGAKDLPDTSSIVEGRDVDSRGTENPPHGPWALTVATDRAATRTEEVKCIIVRY